MLKKESVLRIAEQMFQYLMERLATQYECMEKNRHEKPDGFKEVILSGFTLKSGAVGFIVIVEDMQAMEDILKPEMLGAIKGMELASMPSGQMGQA